MTLTFIQNIGGGFLVIMLLFSLIYFLLWVYCVIDVIRSNFKDQNMKLIWIVILLFAHLIGPLVYLVLGKNSKAGS
jgi:hypothetical protein